MSDPAPSALFLAKMARLRTEVAALGPSKLGHHYEGQVFALQNDISPAMKRQNGRGHYEDHYSASTTRVFGVNCDAESIYQADDDVRPLTDLSRQAIFTNLGAEVAGDTIRFPDAGLHLAKPVDEAYMRAVNAGKQVPLPVFRWCHKRPLKLGPADELVNLEPDSEGAGGTVDDEQPLGHLSRREQILRGLSPDSVHDHGSPHDHSTPRPIGTLEPAITVTPAYAWGDEHGPSTRSGPVSATNVPWDAFRYFASARKAILSTGAVPSDLEIDFNPDDANEDLQRAKMAKIRDGTSVVTAYDFTSDEYE